MVKVQEHMNGWRWRDIYGTIWGQIFYTRLDAMREYVIVLMNTEVCEITGNENANKYNTPDDVVRLLWRRKQRAGEMSLVKSTEIMVEGWVDPGEEML